MEECYRIFTPAIPSHLQTIQLDIDGYESLQIVFFLISLYEYQTGLLISIQKRKIKFDRIKTILNKISLAICDI
jgi:hypothetical protein